jgi:ABC-type sugar transport system ATPase subunit
LNLISGRLANGGGSVQFQSPFLKLALDGALRSAKPDQDAQLGIRPQDIRIVDPEKADAVGRVDVLQPLGSDVIAQFQLSDNSNEMMLTALLPAHLPMKTDDRIGIEFARDRLHVFDVGNGTRIN